MAQEGDLLTDGLDESSTDTTDNQDPAGTGGPGTAASDTDDSKDPPKGWKGQLSEALQGEDRLDKFNGKGAIDKLASAYLQAEERLGRSVSLSEEPTDEELSRVRTLMGCPENKEGYDFSDVELPEEYKLGEEGSAALKAFAYEHGLTQSQAKAQVAYTAKRERDAIAQVRRVFKQHRETSEKALREELGEGFDKNLKAGQRVLQNYGDPVLIKELKETGFGNSPAMIKFLGKLGSAVSEDSSLQNDGPPAPKKGNTAFPVAEQIAAQMKGKYFKD